MGQQEVGVVIETFVQAVEAGDEATLRSIYSDDVRVWHNFDDLTVTKDETIGVLMEIFRMGVRFRHHLEEEFVVGDRVVRRQRIDATTAGGRTVAVHMAFFATLEGGHITRVEEYLDSEAFDALMEAIAAEKSVPAE
jgi:ketosteroid isomerase-like protein